MLALAFLLLAPSAAAAPSTTRALQAADLVPNGAVDQEGEALSFHKAHNVFQNQRQLHHTALELLVN